MKLKSGALLVGIAFLRFIVLGLPGGMLGVAWPSIRGSFGLSLDAVGTLLLASTTGYLLSSFASGRTIAQIGVGPALMIGSILGGLGFLGYILAPAWWVMVLFGLLAGLGTGTIDAGLNTYFAANYGASLMNWLHACFGVGATLGPAIMTAMFNGGHSWHWGYALVVVSEGVLAACFGLTLRRWRLARSGSVAESGSVGPNQARGIDTLKLPAVWLSVLLFFIFTGIEGSAGQWPYSLFTELRSIDPVVAGFWVSVYWGSLTVGRIVFGALVARIGIAPLLRTGMLGVVCGAALTWWNPTDLLGFLGLALMGFSMAPIFPLSISATPQRLGAEHTANAIGFQVAAASLGLGVLPGFAGILAEAFSLEIVGPFLFVTSVAMFLLHEAMIPRVSRAGSKEKVGVHEGS